MSLEVAVARFVGADSWSGSRVVVERHPELLTDAADALLTQMAGETDDAHAAQAFRTHRDLLRHCRERGVAAVFDELIAPGVPAGLRARWAAAEQAHERYWDDADPSTLAAAIERTGAVMRDPLLADVPAEARAGIARAAGVLLVERYLLNADPADLNAAVQMFEMAVTAAAPGTAERSENLSALGNALGMRYEDHGERADLDAGIDALREALIPETLGPEDRRILLHNLTVNLGVRAEIFGDPADLDAAIEYARDGIDAAGEHDSLPAFLSTLTNLLVNRYERDGVLADLRDAAAAAERGIALEPLPELVATLGAVRQLQFDRDHDPATLDAAVVLLRQAADDLAGPYLPICLGHLGNALLTRFELVQHRTDLDDAQAAFDRAVTATDPRSPRAAALRSSLGLTLLERYRHAGGPLVDAVSALEGALRDGAAETRIRPFLLTNLAYAREAQYQRSRTERDLAAAVEAYQQACQEGLAQQLEIALTSARRWGAWASRRASWAEAAGAYDVGLDAAERLWRGQAGRADQEIWLGAAQGMPDRASFARARAGEPHRAVVVLELGRARLLAEALRGGPDQLAAQAPALADRYQRAAARFRSLSQCGRLGDDHLSRGQSVALG
jgi:hypothetical protein